MKKGSTIFLKVVITLIGIGVLALCSFLTWDIAKAGNAVFFPIPIIIDVTAIPFFFALYQALKLLSYIDKNKAFSTVSIKALRNIKHCAITISALYVAGMPFLFFIAEKDDAPGVAGFGLIFMFASIVVATFATVLQRLVQSGLNIKAENDLIV